MKDFKKIVFVTESGTGRAPMAEAIFKSLNIKKEMEICSRGIVVLFPEPLNQKTELILELKGLKDEEYKSVPLTQEDFGDDSLIVVMEASHKEKVLTEFENPLNVFTLKELVEDGGDIESPHGKPFSVYGECFERLEELLKKLAEKINVEED